MYFCRNFPQGTIGDMIKDASEGISFICNNIASYGGDPERYGSLVQWYQIGYLRVMKHESYL